MEELRPLLYPLGFLPLLFFASRFFVQWIYSEQQGRSLVPRAFWQLSLLGNLLLCLHYLIQVQYPFSLAQAVNAVISWRNLDLMRMHPRYKAKDALLCAMAAAAGITALFMLQSWFFLGALDWVRTPLKLWDSYPAPKYAVSWHVLGGCGALLFAARFWLQWWEVEHTQTNSLSRSFWWLSIAGGLLSFAYFVRLSDVVGAGNYAFGLIAAMRNLILIAKDRSAASARK